jgi:hypothetical protein
MMTDLKWLDYDQLFEYLNADDSRLYALVKSSQDEKDLIIKGLLERIASASRAAHRASKY